MTPDDILEVLRPLGHPGWPDKLVGISEIDTDGHPTASVQESIAHQEP